MTINKKAGFSGYKPFSCVCCCSGAARMCRGPGSGKGTGGISGNSWNSP